MSGKRERRRRAEEAWKAKVRRRRRIALISVTLLLVAALAVTLPIIVARRARLATVNVAVATIEGAPYSLLADALTAANPDAVDGTVEVYSPPNQLAPEERDVLVGQALYGTERERLVSVDPYVLVVDRRAGVSPLDEPGNSLGDLTDWLASFEGGNRTPFVVAGESREDFAALLLYLAGELLDDSALGTFRAELRAASRAGRGERAPTEAMAGDPEAIEELAGQLAPVISFLEEWRSAGILAFNWTNWDRIAVDSAITEGRAAVVFQRRSDLKSLVWQESFHLRMRLPPVGESRGRYSMVGLGISVTAGGGPRSDAAAAVRGLLRDPTVQERLEGESSWSPVFLEGTPINREHRDAVRWVAGAREYLLLESAVVDHLLFRRLHQLLR